MKIQDPKRIAKVEQAIGIIFKNKALLQTALTHKSYVNEGRLTENNERLEFLGDAGLEYIVTQYLYRNFPQAKEGELTDIRSSIVNNAMLSTVAEELDIAQLMYISKGECFSWQHGNEKARRYITGCLIEAIIGAICLDRGIGVAELFVLAYLIPKLQSAIANRMEMDPKSFLQEYIQERYGITPTYEDMRQSGPDHNREFVVGVCCNDKRIAVGMGWSKKQAQFNAARKALSKELNSAIFVKKHGA